MVSISTGKESKQDYSTPKEFIDVITKTFGPIVFDLAASQENTKATNFFSIEDDSLQKCWLNAAENNRQIVKDGMHFRNVLWLNPPFNHIEPWVKKAWETCKDLDYRDTILLLVPASVGSNWFTNWVIYKADISFLNGRLSFDGKSPFPRDLMLLQYSSRAADIGFMDYEPRIDSWNWKNDINR